ncbi:MAG TPA: LysM domain-containing protein [Solirubrobacterales bacterium]|jgi:LysM repeat protein|nr:LysM domain-containing protein [Solirubrobacterales bacterium]
MNKRSSAPARVAAVTTLVVAFVIAVVAIGGALGGGGSNGSGHKHSDKAAHRASQQKRNVPATYEVKSGDTLISIAHHNGVTVARIEALNPEVDPQILIAGEKLKLK